MLKEQDERIIITQLEKKHASFVSRTDVGFKVQLNELGRISMNYSRFESVAKPLGTMLELTQYHTETRNVKSYIQLQCSCNHVFGHYT